MRYTCSILVKVQLFLKCFLLISFYLKHLRRVLVMICMLHTGFFEVSDDWKKHKDTFCCHQGDFKKPSSVITAVSANFGNE